MKMRLAIRIVAMGALLLLLLTGLLIGTFFLTAWLYHTIGHAPPLFLVQVINSLLGLLLYAVILVGFFSLVNSRPGAKRRQMGLFEPIFAAICSIAKGDFQVRLNPPLGANVFASPLSPSATTWIGLYTSARS